MTTENAIAAPGISPLPAQTRSPAAGEPAHLVLRQVNPAEVPSWDTQILAHPHYTFFHGAAWAKVLERTYGFTPVYFTNGASGAGRSLLPMMEVRSWLTSRRAVGLPFTDDSGPLGPDPAECRKLFWGAVELGKARGWRSVECRGGRNCLEEAPASLAFYGHWLDLAGGEDRLFARLDSSVRRAIRKAEKSGVTVTVSRDLQALRTFCSLQCQTRKKHGLPPQPFAFFQNIHEHILSPNLGVIITASHQGRPIAASMYFQLGERAIYKFGASDEAFQELRGSNLVMWEAIKWHVRNGARRLHLGRSSLWNEGLRRFKLGWGAAEERIEYVKYDLRKGRFVLDQDQSSGWHNRVFRRMPEGCARLLGAFLYRHWA